MILDLTQLPFADSVPTAVRRVYAGAREVYNAAAVERAVDRLAVRLTVALQDQNPVFVVMLPDALVLAGMLLRRLVFPLEIRVLATGTQPAAGDPNLDPTLADLSGRWVVLLVGCMSGVDPDAEELRLLREQNTKLSYVSMFADAPATRAADFIALDCVAEGHLGSGRSHLGYGANLPGVYAYELE